MHLGLFGCLTKLGAKWAKLVQKFVPRNRVGIFPNERTRSTPLDPKLTFCFVFHTIWVHSAPFDCLTKLGAKRAELVDLRVTKSRWNFLQQKHPIHPIGPFTHVLVSFVPIGCIWDHYVALRNSVQNGPN